MRIRAHSVSSSDCSRGEPGQVKRAQTDRKRVRARREDNAKGKETHVPGEHTATGFGAPPEPTPGAAIKRGRKRPKSANPASASALTAA